MMQPVTILSGVTGVGRDVMRKVIAAWAGLLVLALPACTGNDDQRRSMAPAVASTSPPASPFDLAIIPERGTEGVPISTEIGTQVTGGSVTEVVLSTPAGDTVPGAMRDDDTAWVPDRPLQPSTTYTATVTATGSYGQEATAETTFTTMRAPDRRTGTGMYLFDDQVYGVGMPVVVEFLQPVPAEYRAGVERRMFVTTDPPQPGVWHWVGDGAQAFYRSRDYWQPGTTISVRLALDGHPTGDGLYGDADRRATVTIGERTEIEIDNATKQLSLYADGELVRTMPVSLGKASTPSSSGQMVIMTKERETVFDTFAELGPEEGYRIDIEYAMRLTWGGEFIHAAPWSVADQGVRNVSHGCINMSTSDAAWLFERAKIGDPVTVKGSERALEHGNGWTAWELSWKDFVAGSALPATDLPATDLPD
jgi:lipoprotein-anchoring transpeptidase ErfK/SrfK